MVDGNQKACNSEIYRIYRIEVKTLMGEITFGRETCAQDKWKTYA